jgi:uncharacterized damage-inducible protein DinB
MQYLSDPEYWQRGPLDGIPGLLQPVAHALLQVRAEVHGLMEAFPENALRESVFGMASPGFHLQHISGVIDRLFTYAREESLSEKQMRQLKQEGLPLVDSLSSLLDRLDDQVDRALDQLKNTDPAMLTATRFVGRKRIPTTMIGLYVHAAEHGMRHLGQLLVTARVLASGRRM